MAFVYLIIIGAIIGWLAGYIMKGGGYGLVGNIILGIVGAVVGGLLVDLLNISFGTGLLSQIIVGVIGACVVMGIIGFIKKN